MKTIGKFAGLAAMGALALAIAGCDDDSTPQRVDISGVVAMGAPVVGAQVRAEGANGVRTDFDLLTDANGNYNLNGFGLTAPITVRSEGGVDRPQFPRHFLSIQGNGARTLPVRAIRWNRACARGCRTFPRNRTHLSVPHLVSDRRAA